LDNELLSLLQHAESYDEGLTAIRDKAEFIDEEMLSAIDEWLKVEGTEQKAKWLKNWHREASAMIFSNELFKTEDPEKARILLASAEPDIARRALVAFLANNENRFKQLSSALSDMNALISNLGIETAKDRRGDFEEELQTGLTRLSLSEGLADKANIDELKAGVYLWEGLLHNLEYDMLQAFEEKDNLKATAEVARGCLKRSMKLTSNFKTRAFCLYNLAKAWYDEDPDKSLECLNVFDKEMERSDVNTIGLDRRFLEESKLMLVKGKSKVLQKLKRFRESYDVLRPAIEELENELWSVVSPNMVAVIVGENSDLYERAVKACFELGQEDAQFLNEAFEYAEKMNARAALNLWRTVVAPGPEVDPELIERKTRLFDELSYKSSDSDTDLSIEELDDLKRVQWEIGAVEQRIWEQSRVKMFDNTAWPASLDQIAKLIPQNTVLIEYFVTPDEIFTFVIDSKGLSRAHKATFQSSDLRGIVDLANVAIGLRENYTSFEEMENRGIKFPLAQPTNLEFLYKFLMEPVKEHLLGKEVAYIVPHSYLRNAPFHAFYRMEGENMRYLIEDIAISYAPSATILRLLDRNPRSLKTCFSAGVSMKNGGPVGGLEEATMVAKIFNSQVIPGTKNAFLSNAGSYDVIHLSCHSIRQSAVTIYNGLSLENAEILLPKDVPELKCSLATLSACSTYSGDTSNTRELAGIVGGFLRAGSRSVVGSLWPVYYKSTYLLMEEFYRNLMAGQSKAVAFQKAQVMVRKTYSYHPLFWAPFFLVGMAD